jgi:DNA-binding NarL/FixJ family response regulator
LIRPRILVAESHPILREATIALLTSHFDVVGSVADGVALVAEASRLCPDVIVSAITLPVLNGIDAVHQLRQSISPFRAVFLTVHAEQEFIDACVAEGALGYVLKSQMKAHLIPAVQAALAGKSYIYPFAPK